MQALIDGVAAGRFDLAVAALTVTADRERVLDFTQAFYVTGLGIAVPVGGEASWRPIIRTLTSFGFAQAIMALVGLALVVGLLVWLFERRHNDDFSGGAARGISSGVWWSAMTMTQRGAGTFGPRTLPGRIVAVLWMIGSIVVIAVFTAGITSVLTIKHLQGAVHGSSDLSAVRVGAVVGTSTESTLSRMQIKYREFASPQDGLKALRARRLDAFVYDKPLLAWIIRQNFSSSIELLEATSSRRNMPSRCRSTARCENPSAWPFSQPSIAMVGANHVALSRRTVNALDHVVSRGHQDVRADNDRSRGS